jgi:nucleoside 2-deoxyribosyltransferase
MSYWYLASPFTHYPEGRHAAWLLACQNTGLLLGAGVKVFSPIVHTYHLEIHGGLAEREHAFWMSVDEPLMHAAYGLIVLEAKGWHVSKGVMQEIGVFNAADKPVRFMLPGVVPMGLKIHG